MIYLDGPALEALGSGKGALPTTDPEGTLYRVCKYSTYRITCIRVDGRVETITGDDHWPGNLKLSEGPAAYFANRWMALQAGDYSKPPTVVGQVAKIADTDLTGAIIGKDFVVWQGNLYLFDEAKQELKCVPLLADYWPKMMAAYKAWAGEEERKPNRGPKPFEHVVWADDGIFYLLNYWYGPPKGAYDFRRRESNRAYCDGQQLAPARTGSWGTIATERDLRRRGTAARQNFPHRGTFCSCMRLTPWLCADGRMDGSRGCATTASGARCWREDDAGGALSPSGASITSRALRV